MKRVLIINQGKSENLGDKAINISLEELFKAHGFLVDTAGYSQTYEQNMSKMNINRNTGLRSLIKKYTPIPIVWLLKYRSMINNEFKHTSRSKSYDLVVIGGGQLIKTKCVFVYALMTWINILKKEMNCPIMLLGVGADNNYSALEKLIYKKVISKMDEIYVRDNKSKLIFSEVFQQDSKLIPDVVFSYHKFFPAQTTDKKLFTVMVYDYNTLKNHFGTKHSKQDYYSEWKNLILDNVRDGMDIVLAYTAIGDKYETMNFASYLRNNSELNFEVAGTDDLDSLVNVLQRTEILLTGRMHGMILGINYRAEVIPYVVSPKIAAFVNDYLKNDYELEDYYKKINEVIESIINKDYKIK
jgi:polysaccharide pyruvyl transferase WcaK-like protein